MQATDSTETQASTPRHFRLVKVAAVAFGAGLLTAVGIGCVDTEPALKVKGFTAYAGTVEQQTLTCNPEAESGDGQNGGGGGGGGTMGPETYPVNYNTVICDTEVDPGDIETFQSEAGLNIDQFAQFGQPGFGTSNDEAELRTAVCQDQKPSNSEIQSSIAQWFAENSSKANYTVSLNIINNLEDNRNTGAQGGGGGAQGGGYEGLYADGNDVKLENILIRFPNLPGGYKDALERDVPVAAVIDSQGGALNLTTVRIFSTNQIGTLRDMHEDLFLNRSGASSYDPNAEVIVKMNVRAQGETLSGKNVVSNELTLPIRLCASGTACTTTGSCGYRL